MTKTIADIEAELAATQEDLRRAKRDHELARDRLDEAADRVADCSSDPHAFARARAARDAAAAETERLSLHLVNLINRRAAEERAAKAARRAALEAEVVEAESAIARLDQEGIEAAGQLAAIVRRIEAARTRGLELNRRLDPRAYPSASEPVEAYRAVAAILNSLRRSCPFTKASPEAERQFGMPDPGQDQAA
jgi:hypothetical protein